MLSHRLFRFDPPQTCPRQTGEALGQENPARQHGTLRFLHRAGPSSRERKRILLVRGRALMRPSRQLRMARIAEHVRERLTCTQVRAAATFGVGKAMQLFQRRFRIISVVIVVATDLRHFGNLYRPAQRVTGRASGRERFCERLCVGQVRLDTLQFRDQQRHQFMR